MIADGRWRCPQCRLEADIKGNSVVIHLVGLKFPTHVPCELAKPVDQMDESKLEPV